VDRTAFKEKQLARMKLELRFGILHPESPPTREDVKIFVARCVEMGRRWFVNSKDAGAGSISIG
jgi:hypothetical protein